jgi:hypothetical protein
MLQFWIPRSPAFEDAILGTMGLPFFQEFDPAAERVTVRILQTLGRFENIDQLPQHTATAILVNDALRQKLTPTLTADEEIALVKETLLGELQDRDQRLANLADKATALSQVSVQHEETINLRNQELARLRAHGHAQEQEIAQLQVALEATEQHAQTQREDQRAVADQLDQRVKELERQDRRAKFVRHHVVSTIAAELCVLLPLAITGWHPVGIATRQIATAIATAIFIVAIMITDARGQREQAVSEWRPFALFHRRKVGIFAVASALILSVSANAVYDLVKSLLGK